MAVEESTLEGTPTSPKAATREFPTHLAPIDRFLLDDDSPRHPMTYVIQMECHGAFDQQKFEQALDAAVDRHPYTRAKIGPGKRGLPSWLNAASERPQVQWGDWDEPIAPPGGEPIDIHNEVGLRIWVRQNEEQSRVVFQWHHAVTDGTGAFRFMGDLLVFYDQACGGDRGSVLELYPALLRERRGRMACAYTAGDKPAVRRAIWRQFREVFTRWAAPLAKPKQSSPATFPGFFLHTFTKDETNTLRVACDKSGVMLNDLLLERLFQALRDWNDRHGRRRPRRPLRIMMPADMRESADTEMPAANMVSYNFLSRPSQACDDSQALLRGIANETDRIKHTQSGKEFIDAITGAEVLPNAMPWLLHRGWCLATAVLTNNGDPARRMNARVPREKGRLKAGNVVVERFSGVPPLRQSTHVVVAAMTYAKQLTLNVRCDPNCFGDGPSREFLQMLINRLSEVLPSTDSSQPGLPTGD